MPWLSSDGLPVASTAKTSAGDFVLTKYRPHVDSRDTEIKKWSLQSKLANSTGELYLEITSLQYTATMTAAESWIPQTVVTEYSPLTLTTMEMLSSIHIDKKTVRA